MDTPCILVTSCSDYDPESVIKDILKTETLPEQKQLIENIVGFDWHISTKYYTADVLLCTSRERTIGDRKFAESVEAFIVCFDADQGKTFELVKAWSPYLEQIEPEIKMLVCDRCTENHSEYSGAAWPQKLILMVLNQQRAVFAVSVNPDQTSSAGAVSLGYSLPASQKQQSADHHQIVIGLKEHGTDHHVTSPLNGFLKIVDPVTRLEVQTWCIDNGFELIELNPELETDSDTEDDFVETTGVKRIVQALHAHTWPNLQMKDNPVHHSPYIRQLMQEEFQSKKVHLSQDNTATNNQTIPDSVTEEQADSVSSKSHSMIEQESVTTGSDVKAEIVRTLTDHNNQAEDKHLTDKSDHVDCSGDAKATDSNIPKSSQKEKEAKQPSKEDTIDSLLQSSDMALFETLGEEDPGGESFEKLFERFGRMKERASHLPPEERKKYAEHVAVAFWRAIGGDEDEIGDLSDSD